MTTKNLDAARELFKKSELSGDPTEKRLLFEKALDLLDSLEENPELQNLIVNIRRSNIRSLLKTLPTLHHIAIELWFHYVLLLIKLRADIDVVLNENPNLNDNHNNFRNLFLDELRDIHKQLKSN